MEKNKCHLWPLEMDGEEPVGAALVALPLTGIHC